MMRARSLTRKTLTEAPETDKQEESSESAIPETDKQADSSESAAPVFDDAPPIALRRKSSPSDHCRCQ